MVMQRNIHNYYYNDVYDIKLITRNKLLFKYVYDVRFGSLVITAFFLCNWELLNSSGNAILHQAPFLQHNRPCAKSSKIYNNFMMHYTYYQSSQSTCT